MPPKTSDRKNPETSEASGRQASEVASVMLSPEILQQILAANSKTTVTALLAALPTPVAAISSSASTTISRAANIKPPRWSDDETPYEYFNKYEKAMKHNKVDKCEWGHLLPVYLSGRAQASFSQVAEETLDDYDLVKEILLESLGDTPASADRRWWTINHQAGEDPGAFYLRVRSTGLRHLHGLKTREEVVERTILSRYLSLLPQECYSSVVEKRPKDGQEAARLVQEWEETRGFARRHRPWRTGQRPQTSYGGNTSEQGRRRGYDGEQQGSANVGNVSSASTSSALQNGTHRNASSTQDNASGSQTSGGQTSGGRSSRSERHNQGGKKPVTCFGCGEVGHIRPNCPNRVRRVKSPGHSSLMMVDGSLAGMIAKNLRIDTGAERTVVRQDYVPERAYTGKYINLDSWRGSQPSKHKLVRISIKVGSVEPMCEVAVAVKLDCPALLGTDLGEDIMIALMQHVIEQGTCGEAVSEGASPNLVQQSVPVNSGQDTVLDLVPVRGTHYHALHLIHLCKSLEQLYVSSLIIVDFGSLPVLSFVRA